MVEEVRGVREPCAPAREPLPHPRNEVDPAAAAATRAGRRTPIRAGQSDVTALYLAEQDLQRHGRGAIEVERQAAIALVRLQRAVGGAGVAASVRKSSRGKSGTNRAARCSRTDAGPPAAMRGPQSRCEVCCGSRSRSPKALVSATSKDRAVPECEEIHRFTSLRKAHEHCKSIHEEGCERDSGLSGAAGRGAGDDAGVQRP